MIMNNLTGDPFTVGSCSHLKKEARMMKLDGHEHPDDRKECQPDQRPPQPALTNGRLMSS